MVLGRNVLCAWIENERDQAGMPGGETDKDSLSSSAVPLRDLLTVLEARVQNINRTPKDMSTGKTRAGGLDPRK
mgnify:CR=1 FL=1